jgi:ABC-type bacteriocin/lantibiotic exporter with double-glycine peptidase domain
MKHEDRLHMADNFRSVCIGTTVLKIISIPIALVSAQLLSKVTASATQGDVPAVISDSLIVLAVMILFAAIRTWANAEIRKRTSIAGNKCRVDFMGMLLNNPLNKLFAADQGELNENINDDILTYSKRYTELIPAIVSAALAALLYMLFLSAQSVLVAVTLLAISLLQLLPPLIVKKFMQISYDECRDMEAKITNHVVEAVNGYEIIKLYGIKQWWQEKLAALHKQYLRVGNKSEAVFAAQNAMFQTIDNILRFGTYSLLGIYAMRGYCDLNVVVEAVYLSGDLFGGVKTLFGTIPQFAVARGAAVRLEKWSSECDTQEHGVQPFDSITLHGLHYAVSNAEIIRDASFQFDSSVNYLIKGQNGTGKTTLLNLLTGLVSPTSGQIIYGNGTEVSLLGKLCSKELLYIPQDDPELEFSADTLFRMFDVNAQRKMFSYAEQFGLKEDDLITSISNLSGGERKKVFLSMGFGISPHWLLLDEPTNSLDADGKETLCGLIQMRHGVIMISHDPVLDKTAARTLTLKGGSIVS